MRLYTYRCTVNTRMIAALRMGSDESHFNVSVGSDGQSHFNVSVGSDGQNHKTVYTNHNLSEEKGEPKRYQPNALPLGQTGSLSSRRDPRAIYTLVVQSAWTLEFLCASCRVSWWMAGL